MNKIVIISGPTASGKTAFSVDIAKKIDGEIISCDSMQIYKDMNIGTAKVSLKEMQGIRHHMIDVVNPWEEFSVGEYALRTNKIIDDIICRGKLPIIVGGTGLYIDAILYPMSFGGNKNEEVRKSLEEECEKFGKEYMHGLLAQIDPSDAEKIHPNNIKRVLRALEIYRVTGKCKSSMIDAERQMQYDCCMAVLSPNRETLYKKIDMRVDCMFDNGLIDEVKSLLSSGVSFDNQSMQAIGYKELKEYFENNIDSEVAREKIKQNSRNYAKRQITWLKKYNFAKWFDTQSEIGKAEEYIMNYVRG